MPETCSTTLEKLEHKIDTLEEEVGTLRVENNKLADQIQDLTAKFTQFILAKPVEKLKKVSLKPSPPSKFSGDRSKGQAFLNLCQLYIQLALEQFEDDSASIYWAITFMKSGHAALFADHMMRHEAKMGEPKYHSWTDFRAAIIDEFCSKNEAQLSLAKLETTEYHQGW